MEEVTGLGNLCQSVRNRHNVKQRKSKCSIFRSTFMQNLLKVNLGKASAR
jgi:hypothetical protein